ncbi:hypothetical protein [Streptomyces sp. NPDC002265]|uniref:hypothetical protein n=1 Tax=Streptomyces sp. NPDC002265 TaxID=3154415 RepID=UPI00333285EA
MPRSRPGHLRTALPPRRRTTAAGPVIDGLSRRTLSEIDCLERTRNYLQPGDTGRAVRLWKEYVHRSERQLWHDAEWGYPHGDCCGDPLDARALLDVVVRALSVRGARELRAVIARHDAVWNTPTPSYDAE